MAHDMDPILEELLHAITGTPCAGAADSVFHEKPLGGLPWSLKGPFFEPAALTDLLLPLIPAPHRDASFETLLTSQITEAIREASRILKSCPDQVREDWRKVFQAGLSSTAKNKGARENAAVMAGNLWLPELTIPEESILERWELTEVEPNPDPIKPTEVVLQLNALYTVPEEPVSGSWLSLYEEAVQKARSGEREGIAEYDHPVALFAPPEEHELEGCLDELDQDMAFEKSRGVLPQDYRVPVLVSVSVTHPYLDHPAGEWLRSLLEAREFHHLKILLLTEETVRKVQRNLLSRPYPNLTVLGGYGRHFNTLKYFQLFMEKGYGCRAGFKLDTDEGIHSEDLFKATGKTWMETLCDPLWGGTALDWRGNRVTLGFNEGEYVDSRDLDRLGYAGALREPDVKLPSTRQGEELFFPKGIAHARTTALYNREADGDHVLSHPVVKGGGYGVTNQALRQAHPFTHPRVGRAEDQQFYFSALPGGVRGVFIPNLRIIHYKSAVAKSEEKTEATRLLGDMARILLFRHLILKFDIKDDLDPMPGVFASPLARPQTLLHLLYRAWHFYHKGKETTAEILLARGVAELKRLKNDIDAGEVDREWDEEKQSWQFLTSETAGLSPEAVRATLDPLFF